MVLTAFFTRPASTKQRLWLYIITTIGIVFSCWLYCTRLHPIFFPLDDPFITLHNAQVLHWGYDPNYRGVPALAGTTSLVHLAMVWFLLFFLSPMAALLATQWVAIFTYCFGLLQLAFVCRASWVQTVLFLMAGMTASSLSFQLLNGLETGLALATIVWLFVIASLPRAKLRRWLLPILCGVAPFIRPELLVLSLLLVGREIYGNYKEQNALHSILKTTFLFLGAAIPWLIWLWVDTGSLFPNTMMAKLAFIGEEKMPLLTKVNLGWHYLIEFLVNISYLGVIGMVVLLLLTSLGRLGLVFVLGFMAAYTYIAPTLLLSNAWRYESILVPVLLFGIASTLSFKDPLVRKGANCLLILLVLQSLWNISERWFFYLGWRNFYYVQLTGMADWCRQHLPSSSTLLVHDAGYIAFATPFHLIDLVGLKTPTNIAYHQRFTLPTGGQDRTKAIDMIIKASNARYLIVLKAWENDMYIGHDLKILGWKLEPVYAQPQGYTVYRIKKN